MINGDTDIPRSEEERQRLAELLEQISQRLAEKRDDEAELLLREHPQFADRLKALLPAMRLLANVGQLDNSPVSPATAEGPATTDAAADAHIPDSMARQIGDFRILSEIGRGGMGVVYEAEQISLSRRVALKVLPMAGCLDPQQLQRFRNEARAVAGLHHPHIVPVYAVGSDRGVHFYAMHLIEGQSLAEIIGELRQSRAASERRDKTPDPGASDAPTVPTKSATTRSMEGPSTAKSGTGREHFRQVARWGIQAAQALGHAHETGLVHRDIKPSNLLVNAQGHLWVTDFGLALTSVDSDLTLTGDIVGTLRYMSPEQACGNRRFVDQRTDVYSLGLTLYELLTLVPVYSGRDRVELLRQIDQVDPRPPCRLDRRIPADLQTIVMKAIDRDPALRYQSAGELAEDLERWLADVPIHARPSSWMHRATKWMRRHRGVMGVGIAGLLLCLVALLVSMVLIARERDVARASANREADQRRIAVAQRDVARYNLYVADMNLAHQAWKGGNVGRMVELLESHVPPAGENDLRGWEWHYLTSLSNRGLATIPNDGGVIFGLDWSPDGRFLAMGGEEVRVWDDVAQRVSLTLRETRRAVWSPDGRRLATVTNRGVVKLWDPFEAKELLTLGESWAADTSLSWSPDGKQLATGDQSGHIRIWNTELGGEPVVLHDKLEKIRAVAWSPDGRSLAAAGNDGSGILEVWDSVEHKLLRTIPAHDHYIQCLAWSPDGRSLASGSNDQCVKVWDATTWSATFSQHEHFGRVNDLHWSPDSRYFVSSSDDSTVLVWEPAAGRLVNKLRGHRSQANAVAWSPRSSLIVSAGRDPVIRIWDPFEDQEASQFDGEGTASWSPDGQRIATNGHGPGLARVVDAQSGQLESELRIDQKRFFSGAAWSPDGKRIALCDGGGTIRLWDPASGNTLWHVPESHAQPEGPGEVRCIAWSPDGQFLVTAGTDGIVQIRDPGTGKAVHSLRSHGNPVGTAVWSSDGLKLASKDWTQRVKLWDARTWREEREWQAPSGTGRMADGRYSLAWSPDAARLAAGSSLGWIVIWDVATGRELVSIRAHTSNVLSVAWSSDGKRLASGSDDHITKVWDAETGREMLSLDGDKYRVTSVNWSPDSRHLAVAGANLRVYSAIQPQRGTR